VITKFLITRDKDIVLIIEPYLILLLSLLVTWIIISRRFLAHFTPQGFDTASYIYYAELLRYGNYTEVFTSAKIVPYLISYLIYELSGESIFLTGILLPYVFSTIYVLLIFLTVNIIKKDKLLASLCSLSTPLTFFFVRLTYDLLAQTLVLGLVVLALALFSRVVNEFSMRSLLYFAFSLLMIILIHSYTAILTLPFLSVAMIYYFFSQQTITKDKLIILMTIIALSAIITLVILYDRIMWFLFTVIPREFHFSIISTQYWEGFVRSEVSLVWLVSIVGVLYMGADQDSFNHIFSLWLIYIVIIVFTTGYIHSYRFLLYIPEGIYMGFGLYFMIKKFPIKPRKIQEKILGLALVTVLLLSQFMAVYPRAYIKAYVYYPPNETVSQLYYIREYYGFGNKNILVMVYDGYRGSYWWVYAITGAEIFIGSLESLVVNQTDILNRRIEINNDTTIVFGTHIYGAIPEIVVVHGEKISSGIYIIKFRELIKYFSETTTLQHI